MFNWFKQAAGAVGNLFNQGSRYVGSTFNNADRQRKLWEQQARQGAVQAQRQVQQQVQQVQRQAPKVPQVDFSAVIKNLQALRNQPQVQKIGYAANPVNQFKELNKQVINPLNQFGQNQVNRAKNTLPILQQANQQALRNPIIKAGLNVPFSNPVSSFNALSNPRKTFNDTRGAREMFFGKTGELLNTGKSLAPASVVLGVAPYEIAGKALGIKPLENRARQVRNQAFGQYANQSQTGINPVGSQQQRDIDSGGLKGLGAFARAMGVKGAGAGLEIAPVVTGSAAGVPLKSALLRGGTLGAGGNIGYSAVSGYYSPQRSAQEKAIQLGTDIAGGYGGELLGYGLGRAMGKKGAKTIQDTKGYTGNLIDEMNTKFRQGKIDEKQFRAFVVDDFTKKNGRMPMPADVDSFVDVATGRMNRPYVEALRARTQAQASGQAQLPVGRRVAQDVPENPLFNEARKYKSADEFVKAQGTPVYHGTSANRENLINKEGFGANSFFSTDKGNAKIYADVFDKDARVIGANVKLNKPIKVDVGGDYYTNLSHTGEIYYPDGTSHTIADLFGTDNLKGLTTEDVVAKLKASGEGDGVIFKNILDPKKDNVIVAFDKSTITTHKQLTDLYNQATKGVESKGKPIYELAPKPDAQVPVKASGISKSLQKSGSEIYADIPGYIPVKNKALLNISENRVANNERAVIDSIVNRQPNQPITPQMNADSVYLLNKLLKEGRDDEALAIAKATAKNATSAGRAVQILSQLQQTTPEGALVKAQKVVNEVNAKAKKQIATLDAKKQEDIIALANEVQKYKPETRDWQVAAGKLAKYIENLKPVTKGAKVSMVQTMAQLLNPKTAIRNIVGNVGMSGGEDIASIPATLLDKIVSKKTGIRTTAISNPIVGIKGAIKGAKYGIEDTKLGIKTLGGQSKFDVRPDVFKKGVMKKLQNALGYELGVPDKAFYQSAFDKTLDSTMRANKTKTPTAEMLDIANAEALYATFQNNSAIGNALQKTKGVLNLGKDFGAGDFIIKYPKTPGNIVSAGLDYSPVGMAKGITSLARNLNSMTPAVQREAVRNIGRGITGTGAIAMGVILAQNGIITGKKDSDKDIAALDREQGMGPFSFNATALQRFIKGEDTKTRPGDVVANYDWLQPAAIQLSMGANAVLNMGKGTDDLIGDALESIGDSANTIVEQPVLQGISRFVNNLNPQYGGGLGKAITDVASGIPSSFVPGSVNQIGQFMDNTARSSYDPNAVNEAVNKVKARIPVLRESLQPSVTTLGQPREQYQNGSNNIFNVFFNPAFIKTIEDNEVRDLVKGIQDRSGETQQAPRVPDKKVRINGQDKQLTAEEYNKYQTYVGQKTNEAFTRLANDPRFNSLSDTDKAKYMSGKLTDINAAAKSELFGNESTAGGDRIKTGELGYETAEDRKAKKPKTTKAKKAKKGKVAKAKKGRKGRVAKAAKLPSIRLSAPKKVALAKVAKLRSPKVRYPRLAKSNKTPKIKV